MSSAAQLHRVVPLTRDSARCLARLAEGDIRAAVGKVERLLNTGESKVVPERDLTGLGSVYQHLTHALSMISELVRP